MILPSQFNEFVECENMEKCPVCNSLIAFVSNRKTTIKFAS